MWVDLKGVSFIPDTLHHVVFRVDPRDSTHLTQLKNTRGGRVITDGVHPPIKGNSDLDSGVNTPISDPETSLQNEDYSQRVKEMKLQALLGIVDKFEVGGWLGSYRVLVMVVQIQSLFNLQYLVMAIK